MTTEQKQNIADHVRATLALTVDPADQLIAWLTAQIEAVEYCRNECDRQYQEKVEEIISLAAERDELKRQLEGIAAQNAKLREALDRMRCSCSDHPSTYHIPECSLSIAQAALASTDSAPLTPERP